MGYCGRVVYGFSRADRLGYHPTPRLGAMVRRGHESYLGRAALVGALDAGFELLRHPACARGTHACNEGSLPLCPASHVYRIFSPALFNVGRGFQLADWLSFDRGIG